MYEYFNIFSSKYKICDLDIIHNIDNTAYLSSIIQSFNDSTNKVNKIFTIRKEQIKRKA